MERDEYARMAALEASLWWYRALHRYLIERIAAAALPPAARVLDAGCGTGGLLSGLREARPDLALEGLDLDPEAAEIAVARVACLSPSAPSIGCRTLPGRSRRSCRPGRWS